MTLPDDMSYDELLQRLSIDLPSAIPGFVQSSIGGSSGSTAVPTQNSVLVYDAAQQLYVPPPSTPPGISVPLTAAFGGGTATICRKFYDGTVEWFTNLYTSGQPSAAQIQVTSGLSSSLIPGGGLGVINNGFILASYDGLAYYAYFSGGELWVRTIDFSSRTQWNPIFNSLRYSTR